MRTFKQSFDLLTEAYINGEVNPYDSHFCFCGNLENNNVNWQNTKGYTNTLYKELNYTADDYIEMELAFMSRFFKYFGFGVCQNNNTVKQYNSGTLDLPGYEDVLWQAFNDALEVLRQIHIARGEEVELAVMGKRVKQNSNQVK